MAEEKDVVKEVVEVLHDGHKGFAELAEHIKDPHVKGFFVTRGLLITFRVAVNG